MTSSNERPRPPKATDSARETAKDSRELLLEAARKVFAEHGYEGATVKHLADAAGVNVSLVSYYFGGKEGLYRACLETFSRQQFDTVERVLKPVASAEEFKLRLRLYAEEFLSCHLSQQEICKIIHRDFDGRHPIALDVFKTSFVPTYMKLMEFVRSAQDAGVVRKDLDPDITTSLMTGGLVHMIRIDPLRLELVGNTLQQPEFLEKVISHFVENISRGILESGSENDKTKGKR